MNGEERLSTLLGRSPGVKAWEDDDGWRGSALFASEITTYPFAAGNSWPGKGR